MLKSEKCVIVWLRISDGKEANERELVDDRVKVKVGPRQLSFLQTCDSFRMIISSLQLYSMLKLSGNRPTLDNTEPT